MRHQIENLAIQAFRQLHDLELNKCGRVNLLVGANNSGKTSLLEAIACFCRPVDPLEWLAVARGRNVKSSRESLLEGLRWMFPQESSNPDDPYFEGEIHMTGTGTFPCLECSAHYDGFGADEDDSSSSDDEEEDGDSSSSNSFGYVSSGADITLSAHVPPDRWMEFDADPNDGRVSCQFEILEDERFVQRDPPLPLKLPVMTVSPVYHRVEQLQVSQLTDATLTGGKFNVLQCVNLIDQEIQGLDILSRQGIRPTLWVQHRQTGYAPLYTLGDGVRRVLTLALSLIEAQNGVLLIDEIETAIHKDALSKVFKWLVQAAEYRNVQLFASTHSLEAVDAMLTAKLDEPAEIVAYQLPTRGRGTVKRFEGDILENLRFERGLDIR